MYVQMTEELQQARRTYEALNAQLLSELPQLYVLGLDILQDCIARLVHAQKVFFDDALQLMEQLLSVSCLLTYFFSGVFSHISGRRMEFLFVLLFGIVLLL